MDPNGSQWIPMDPNTSQYIPMDPNGSQLIPNFSSLALTVGERRWFEDFEEKVELMNE